MEILDENIYNISFIWMEKTELGEFEKAPRNKLIIFEFQTHWFVVK